MASKARHLGISRALLQVHLRKLEADGLVTSSVEVSDDGKAMKFHDDLREQNDSLPLGNVDPAAGRRRPLGR